MSFFSSKKNRQKENAASAPTSQANTSTSSFGSTTQHGSPNQPAQSNGILLNGSQGSSHGAIMHPIADHTQHAQYMQQSGRPFSPNNGGSGPQQAYSNFNNGRMQQHPQQDALHTSQNSNGQQVVGQGPMAAAVAAAQRGLSNAQTQQGYVPSGPGVLQSSQSGAHYANASLQTSGQRQHPNGLSLSEPQQTAKQSSSQSAGTPLMAANASPPQAAPSVSYPWSQRQVKLNNVLPATPVPGRPVPPPHVDGPSPSPFPRYGHSANAIATSVSGDIFVFGGLVRDSVRNDLYIISTAVVNGEDGQYSTSSESKVLAASPIQIAAVSTGGNHPCPRVGHAATSVGNVLIVWGGDTKSREDEQQDNNIYLLNINSRDWTMVKVTGQIPSGRYGHAATMLGSRFYIFGGSQDVPPGAPEDAAYMNDLWCFDLQHLKAGKPTWNQINAALGANVPPARTGHSMITFGESLFIFGGTDGNFHYNDTWRFDTVTKVWTELNCIGYIPVPREGHAATLVDDVIYVFGGRSVDGKDLEDLAAFKISNQRWYMFTNMGPAPSGRSGHAMAAWQNKVLVIGGETYTSGQNPLPNVVHMLDTAKIKYPSDSKSGNRKSSNSKVSQNGGPELKAPSSPPTIAMPQSAKTTAPSSAVEGHQLAITVAAPSANGLGTQFPVGSTATRTEYALQNSMFGLPQQATFTGPAERSLSPPNVTRHTPNNAVVSSIAMGSGPLKISSSSQSVSTIPTTSISALRGTARSPSPIQRDDSGTVALNGSSNSVDAVIQSRQRDAWLRAALTAAVGQGYTLPDQPVDAKELGFGKATGNLQLLDAMLAMRKEIADVKSAAVEDARASAARMAAAEAQRNAIVQEAAFYRAKVAALESQSAPDLNRLEKSRTAELEQRIQQLGRSRAELERDLATAQAEAEHHRTASQAATERESASIERADAAEASYGKALSEYADLQRRVHVSESSLQEHTSKVVGLESRLAQLDTAHSDVSGNLAKAQTSLQHHLRTLEQTHTALSAANAQASEMEALWSRAKADLALEQDRAHTFEAEASRKNQLLDKATAALADLEKAIAVCREENEALRTLTSNQLKQLLGHHESQRSIDRTAYSVNSDVLRKEAEQHQLQTREAHARVDASQAELRESRTQQLVLEKQLATVKSELLSLRDRHANALLASSRSQTLVSQREHDLRERSAAAEAAEVRLGLMKSLLAENGLASDEASSPNPNASASGTVNSGMKRKMAELEANLDQREVSLQEMSDLHAEARQQADMYSNRLRLSEEEIVGLQSQVEQLRIAVEGGRATPGGAQAAQKELAVLQEKYASLDSQHSKAVQYVKGTEKMMRRMKDELVKYKERNEALENELSRRSPTNSEHSRQMSAELRPELDNLRSQLIQLRKQSETTSAENEELQHRMKKLQAHYDKTISDHQSSSSGRIAESETEIKRLDEELERAQKELQRTLLLNKKLDGDLKSLQQRAMTPTQGTSVGNEAWKETKKKLEADLAAALSQADWMKHENRNLEEKCQEAESKITLLLDHIEGSEVVEAVGSSVGNSVPHDRWKAGSANGHQSASDSEVRQSFESSERPQRVL